MSQGVGMTNLPVGGNKLEVVVFFFFFTIQKKYEELQDSSHFTASLLVITPLLLGAWGNTAEETVKFYMPVLPKECIQMNAWQAEPAGSPRTAWRYYHWESEQNLFFYIRSV